MALSLLQGLGCSIGFLFQTHRGRTQLTHSFFSFQPNNGKADEDEEAEEATSLAQGSSLQASQPTPSPTVACTLPEQELTLMWLEVGRTLDRTWTEYLSPLLCPGQLGSTQEVLWTPGCVTGDITHLMAKQGS